MIHNFRTTAHNYKQQEPKRRANQEMSKTELVFVPAPGMGHLLSTVELAKLIVQRNDRVSVFILIINFPFDFATINSYVDSQARTLDPTRITFHPLPTPPDLPDPASINFFFSLIDLSKPLIRDAVLGRTQSGPKLAGFVLDMFCTVMVDVADELGVPSYIFFTSGANFLNVVFHALSLADVSGVDVVAEFSDPDKEFEVPGFQNRVPGKVIPSVFLDEEDGWCEMMLNHARRFVRAKGIMINTFMGIETYGIKLLMDKAKDGKIPAVYPVGPILELDKGSRNSGAQKEEEQEGVIMRWLNEQPDGSVVFLCFGSMGSFGEDQVKEIANGLDKSGHRFLWSLRRPPARDEFAIPSLSDTYVEALPEGFLDRTSQRGKIIGWAPQVSILAHKAIGGFVSHCGWNSTLESMWFGVPMATWPMYAEQQLNAFQLVKELGLAVEIRMDYRRDWKTREGNFVVKAEEVENGVKKLMEMDEGMRKRVKDTSEEGKKALSDGGSSSLWLGQFIADVLGNVELEWIEST